jgi:carbon monoxide dehydrogenase subunit G
MSKTVLSNSVLINAPKAKVWEVLADIGNVSKLSKGVVKSYLTSDKKNGLDATRHCDLAQFGAQVEERITAWKEGESMTINIYERKNLPLMVDVNGSFELKEEGDKTRLIGVFEYKMTNFIGTIMNTFVMKPANKKGWRSFLAGVKHHIETGEEITSNTKVDLSQVK